MAADLLDSIASGDLDPIYVLSSEHPVLIERVVTAIREVTVPPAARGFNYDVVEGKPTGNRIVALAQTLPMMAKYRMVYVRDLAGQPADEAEPLLAYLAKPNPSTVIVAVTSKLDTLLREFKHIHRRASCTSSRRPAPTRCRAGWATKPSSSGSSSSPARCLG